MSVFGDKKFDGEVCLGGVSTRFTSQERFDRVCDGLATQLVSSPDAAVGQWHSLSQMLGEASGVVVIDGTRRKYRDLDELMEIEDRYILTSDTSTEVPTHSQPGGTLIFKGVEHRFSSRDEYRELRARLLEPLKQLNLPSLKEMQWRRGQQRVNPFRK